MLTTYNFMDTNPVMTPAITGIRLSKNNTPTTSGDLMQMQNISYQNAVGVLNHCAVMTCPDISLAIQKVSQFAANPGPPYWEAVK